VYVLRCSLVKPLRLWQTLCAEEDRSGGVLSATCRDLADFVTPMPASYYSETKCNWASEDARPLFMAFDAVPAQCVDRGAAQAGGSVGKKGRVGNESDLGHYLMGAAVGVAVCVCAGLALLAYVHRWLGFRLSFVQLREEQGEPLSGSGHSSGAVHAQSQLPQPPLSAPQKAV
jgi:hypothetical protein